MRKIELFLCVFACLQKIAEICVTWSEEVLREVGVRELERKIVRRKLDVEMRPYRRAALEKNSTDDLLRAVREVLRFPVLEVAAKAGVTRSVLFGLEVSERRRTISLQSLSRVAKAMGCKVVYGVVPEGGLTLEELAEERRLMTPKKQGSGVGRAGTKGLGD